MAFTEQKRQDAQVSVFGFKSWPAALPQERFYLQMRESDLRKRNGDLLCRLKTAESERLFADAVLDHKVSWERSTLKRIKRAAELQVRARLQMQEADRVMSNLGIQLNLACGEDVEQPGPSPDVMQDDWPCAGDMEQDSPQSSEPSVDSVTPDF